MKAAYAGALHRKRSWYDRRRAIRIRVGQEPHAYDRWEDIRDLFHHDKDWPEYEPWMDEIQHGSKAEAIKMAAAAYKTNVKRHGENGFVMKKSEAQVCYFDRTAKAKFELMPDTLNPIKCSCKTSNRKKNSKRRAKHVKRRCKHKHAWFRTRRRTAEWIQRHLDSLDTLPCIVSRKAGDRWYLHVPIVPEEKAKADAMQEKYEAWRAGNQKKAAPPKPKRNCLDREHKPKAIHKQPIVGLDPGVRTFQTYYAPAECGKLGDGFCDRLTMLHKRLDTIDRVLHSRNLGMKADKVIPRLQHMKSSRYSGTIQATIARVQRRIGANQAPCKRSVRRRRLKRRQAVLRAKIRHIVDDLHWHTASYLTKRFKVILIPPLATKRLAQGRKLTKMTKRNMQALSHFRFRQRLIHKAMLNGSHAIVCSESHTTKTCGVCGTLHPKVGSNKVYRCQNRQCRAVIDRDVNGARNVLIRSITKLITAA